MNSQLNRREALLGFLALGGAFAVGSQSASAAPQSAIDSDIAELEQRHRARIGLWAVDLHTGAAAEHRATERFAMCSTFKTYAAARALQLAADGQLNMTEPIAVSATDIVVNSPVTSTRAGASMTVDEICDAALTQSDNTAGNLLLRIIGGPPAVTAFARTLGDQDTRLDRWEPELNAATPGDPRDTTTPGGLGAGYRRLLTGDALTPVSSDRLLDWMRANVTSAKRFRAGIPPGWTSADKTGAGDYGSTNDAGVLYGPTGQRVVMVVLTRSSEDRKDADPLNEAIADTVRLTLGHFGYR